MCYILSSIIKTKTGSTTKIPLWIAATYLMAVRKARLRSWSWWWWWPWYQRVSTTCGMNSQKCMRANMFILSADLVTSLIDLTDWFFSDGEKLNFIPHLTSGLFIWGILEDLLLLFLVIVLERLSPCTVEIVRGVRALLLFACSNTWTNPVEWRTCRPSSWRSRRGWRWGGRPGWQAGSRGRCWRFSGGQSAHSGPDQGQPAGSGGRSAQPTPWWPPHLGVRYQHYQISFSSQTYRQMQGL